MVLPFFATPSSSPTAPPRPLAASTMAPVPPLSGEHLSGEAGSPPAWWENISLSWLRPAGPASHSPPPPPMANSLLAPSASTGVQLCNSPSGLASSSRTSTSPRSQYLRSMKGGLNVQEGEGRTSKKRKSPYTTLLLFRSPLSPMLLSPQLRSPTTGHGRSPLATRCSRAVNDIDLNSEAYEDVSENAQSGFIDGAYPHAREEDENESNIRDVFSDGADPHAHQENKNNSNTGVDLQAQENARRRVVVPNEKRRAIFDALVAKAKSGNLKGHETKETSEEFSVPLQTVQCIWKKEKSCLDQGQLVDVSSQKTKCGRKKIEVDVSTLRDLPLSSRTTIHDVAQHFGISLSKLHSLKREGIIKHVSNSIKPYLTDNNKKDRLKWCVSMLDPNSIPHDPMFRGLFDYVFIDEKWYYIMRKSFRYYTVPGEEQPTRTCKNKNYIPKIMILTVIARPRFDSDGHCTFDGKIGCFPFVTYEPARRSSANRPAGTIEMKPIESVTKDAIRAKWPREDAHKTIFIQQDNARPHLSPNDIMFCEAAKLDGFDMRLVCQPANSPYFNVLDLGFFNSIQSIQYKTSSKTTEELVAAVDEEVMKVGGGNGYDVPHIRKGMLERQGCLSLQLKCEAQLVQAAMAQMNE